MAVRKADAVWNGTLKEGNGVMKLGGGAYEGPFSFSSRFEEGAGTNPEELIAAALAGCFSMAFGVQLEQAGHPAEKIESTAKAKFEKTDAGWRITTIDLDCRATVPGIDESTFQEKATAAKNGCPISNALSDSITINLDAKLV